MRVFFVAHSSFGLINLSYRRFMVRCAGVGWAFSSVDDRGRVLSQVRATSATPTPDGSSLLPAACLITADGLKAKTELGGIVELVVRGREVVGVR